MLFAAAQNKNNQSFCRIKLLPWSLTACFGCFSPFHYVSLPYILSFKMNKLFTTENSLTAFFFVLFHWVPMTFEWYLTAFQQIHICPSVNFCSLSNNKEAVWKFIPVCQRKECPWNWSAIIVLQSTWGKKYFFNFKNMTLKKNVSLSTSQNKWKAVFCLEGRKSI